MDQLGQRIKQVSNELKEYVETRIELLIISLGDQATFWVGNAIQQLISFTVLSIGILFGLIALGFYLGELLKSNAIGFGIVGGVLFFVGLILVLAKPKNISRRIQNQIMNDVIESLESNKEKKEPVKYLEEKPLKEK